MADFVLRTVADELLELVGKHKKISVEDASKKLKMPAASVQALVDFLVEEKVFGIEYKFTTPYIYLYKEGVKQAKGKENSGRQDRRALEKVPFIFIDKFVGLKIPLD